MFSHQIDKIQLLSKESKSWVKELRIEREGETYDITLCWDDFNGYEIVGFYKGLERIPTPEWADVPEFEYNLDSATEEESNA